jgi:C4-dicarboxylate-specific signal transduction histidine kinase
MQAIPGDPIDWAWIALVAVALQVMLVLYALRQRRRRRKAEIRNAENQERLDLIASMSGFGFWSWDAATDQVWASAHARAVLGIDPYAPLVSGTVLAAIHSEDRNDVLDTITSSARDEDQMERELRVVDQDEIRWITVKARTYRDAKDVARRVTGYVVDDSQRKRTAGELRKLQQKLTHLSRVAQLGELSGALAHELQQPLTAILCNVQAAQLLVAKDPPELNELNEILEEIADEDKHAGELIQRLRALLLRGEAQLQRIGMNDLLTDVLTLVRGTVRERNVQIRTRIDEHLPSIQGDRVELQQVFLNLILNACESMSANPARDRRLEIVTELDADRGMVRTSILDCGTGIEPDKLEAVFEPFFTTKEQGLGLGLSICQSIIAAHGGRLWATNRSDRGAAFHFTLPVLVEAAMTTKVQ